MWARAELGLSVLIKARGHTGGVVTIYEGHGGLGSWEGVAGLARTLGEVSRGSWSWVLEDGHGFNAA